jgi:hypothetical protein
VNGLRDLQQLCAMSWMDKHGGDSKTVQFDDAIDERAIAGAGRVMTLVK